MSDEALFLLTFCVTYVVLLWPAVWLAGEIADRLIYGKKGKS